MSCADIRPLMDAALDGERPRALAEHLATCPTCAEEWRRLTELERLLRRAAPVVPPAGFQARVMARVVHDGGGRETVVSLPRHPLLTLATLITGCLLITVGLAALAHAFGQPGELSAWLGILGGVIEGTLQLAAAALAALQRDVVLWPLSVLLAVVLALIWFGALVLPRAVVQWVQPR